MVIFAENDYDFDHAIIRTAFLKHERDIFYKLYYVCNIYYYSLWKEKGKEPKLSEKKQKVDEPDVYLCTCCHQEKKSRKQIVYFKLKNYDFGKKVVSNALAKDIHCKNSLLEYICKVCHRALCFGKGTFPRMPPNVVAKKGKICEDCQKNNSRYNVIEEKWDNILKTMKSFKNFHSLARYVRTLPDFHEFSSLVGNRHLPHYRRDALAHLLIPDDSPVIREEGFPMYTHGDGNCFLYSLSRIIYGHEDHHVEMKVRLIVEAVRDMDHYLDHEYLCREYDFPYGREKHMGSIYCTYWTDYVQGMDVTGEKMVEFYKNEVMSLTKDFQECGIWQIHQATSVLGWPIHTIFPHCALPNLRKDHNWLVLPGRMITNENVYVMWTQSSMHSLGFNHFVPLFQRDRRIEFLELNVDQMLGKKSKMHERTGSHIDLTSDEGDGREKVVDCKNEQLVDLKCTDNGTVCDTGVDDDENGKNIGNSSFDNIQEDGSVWEISCSTNDKCKSVPEKICTCCHIGSKILRIFKIKNYDMDDSVVKQCLFLKTGCHMEQMYIFVLTVI